MITLKLTFSDGTTSTIFSEDIDKIENFIQDHSAERIAQVVDFEFS